MSDTDDVAQMTRPGFWRRFWALFFDSAIVLIPLQILVIVLYAQTNGAIQGTFGFTTTSCYVISALPDGLKLDPPPPADFDTFSDCHVGLLGLDMARTLIVSKTTIDGSVTRTMEMTYALSPDGVPRSAFTTDIPAILILTAYLVLMEHRSGATFGKRAVKIRCIDLSDAARTGLPLNKALIRNLAMWIGSIPILVLMAFLYFRNTQAAPNVAGIFLLLVFAGIISAGWIIWILVSVAQKRDPIYDLLAGTAVIRTGAPDPSLQTPPAPPSTAG